jgi:hypothetical protein
LSSSSDVTLSTEAKEGLGGKQWPLTDFEKGKQTTEALFDDSQMNGTMTLSITTLSIMTFITMKLSLRMKKCNTQQNSTRGSILAC